MTSWLWVVAMAPQIGMVLAALGCGPTLGFYVIFDGNTVLGLQHSPTPCKTMKPDMVLNSSWVWVSLLSQMALQATQICTSRSSSTALGHQHGLWSQRSVLPSTVHQHRPGLQYSWSP